MADFISLYNNTNFHTNYDGRYPYGSFADSSGRLCIFGAVDYVFSSPYKKIDAGVSREHDNGINKDSNSQNLTTSYTGNNWIIKYNPVVKRAYAWSSELINM